MCVDVSSSYLHFTPSDERKRVLRDWRFEAVKELNNMQLRIAGRGTRSAMVRSAYARLNTRLVLIGCASSATPTSALSLVRSCSTEF